MSTMVINVNTNLNDHASGHMASPSSPAPLTDGPEDLEPDIIDPDLVRIVHTASTSSLLTQGTKAAMEVEAVRQTRKVYMSAPEKCVEGEEERPVATTNFITTQKYTLLTFFPKNLIEQFARIANFYFLLMVIIVVNPYIQSIEPYTSIAPLAFVLSVTGIKEAYEDYQRYLSDTQVNARISHLVIDARSLEQQVEAQNNYFRWYHPLISSFVSPSYLQSRDVQPIVRNSDRSGKMNSRASCSVTSASHLHRICWDAIRVGDILRIDEGEEFPADMVLLSSSEKDGTCTIVTANLDGESSLKTMNSVSETAHFTDAVHLYESLAKLTWIECEFPNPNMHNFEGVFHSSENPNGIPLGKENLLLRGAALQNTAFVYGLCLYTGRETKLFLNSNEPAFKQTNVDSIVNYLMYTIFVMLFLVCLTCGIGAGLWQQFNAGSTYYYLRFDQSSISSEAATMGIESFFTYSVLFSLMVPISLYVSIELVKVFQAFMINNDIEMYHAESDVAARARTSSLNEELGQIDYVFSDKTGTLTQNQMAFFECAVNGVRYGHADEYHPLPVDRFKTPDFVFYDEIFRAGFAAGDLEIEEFVLCLALCHGCLPFLNTDKKFGKYKYVSSSPDEVSLTGAAAQFGAVFARKNGRFLTLEFPLPSRLQKYAIEQNKKGAAVVSDDENDGTPFLIYELLDVIEFTSERRRMSVLIRCPDGSIKLYCKGADSSMMPRLNSKANLTIRDRTQAYLDEYSVQGLRCLCIASRILPPDVYNEWSVRYKAAGKDIGQRKLKMEAVAEDIEKGMDLIGITAIEDKLQDGVPQAISKLRRAGIKVWVLTGDKRETAINIGKSCALIDPSLKVFIIEGNSASKVASCIRQILASIPSSEVFSEVAKSDCPPIKMVQFSPPPVSGYDSYDGLAVSKGPWSHKGFAIVADGQALSFVFSKPTVRDLFLQLVQHSAFKTCICARMAPKQKSSVVQLVKKNLGAVTLAIGDGANDVSMIQAAHVGIGISGKEGRQAVNSSDYAIGQFRFLSRLLLVHGRYSYKRLSKILLYSFMKNMICAYTQLFFAFYSGFSGMEFFDGLLLNTFNVFFTSLPIIFVASLDRECSDEEQWAYPELYIPGRLKLGLDTKIFWSWLLAGIRDSVVCFFVPFYSMSYTLQSADHPSIEIAIYTIVIIVVNFKMFMFTNSWTLPNAVISFLSISVYFLFIFLYCSTLFIADSPYITGAPAMVFSTAAFWLSLLFCVVATFIPEFTQMFYSRNYTPSLKHIIQERRIIFGDQPEKYGDYAAPEFGKVLDQVPSGEVHVSSSP